MYSASPSPACGPQAGGFCPAVHSARTSTVLLLGCSTVRNRILGLLNWACPKINCTILETCMDETIISRRKCGSVAQYKNIRLFLGHRRSSWLGRRPFTGSNPQAVHHFLQLKPPIPPSAPRAAWRQLSRARSPAGVGPRTAKAPTGLAHPRPAAPADAYRSSCHRAAAARPTPGGRAAALLRGGGQRSRPPPPALLSSASFPATARAGGASRSPQRLPGHPATR